MGILDIFSKRNKPAPDVFQYDELPKKLRVQIGHLFENAIGDDWQEWGDLARSIACEHGMFNLPTRQGHSLYDPHDYCTDCVNYVLSADTELALDLIEVAFRVVDQHLRNDYHHWVRRSVDADGAIRELNHRFRENGVGYAYENGNIVRVDSQVLHADVVKPAFALLRTAGFSGPNTEFMAAHEHFRHGQVEAAIAEAGKAFESTMKAICEQRKWPYDKTRATASDLIRVIIDKGLVPKYSDEQLQHVNKVLIGVSTIRNKNAGHGAGAEPRDVPDHYAAYALHLAASNIVFLVECHKALPK